MKRAAIAAAWIAGATVPLLLATVYLVGCCVLPFHQTLHRLMPICSAVASFMSGEHDAAPSSPAREKQEPVKRIAAEAPRTFRLAMSAAAQYVPAPAAVTSYRSFISLGAIRCDQDVGLHLLVETFRI